MSMLTLNGTVQNVFAKPESKDKETGEIRPSTVNAQILAENIPPLVNRQHTQQHRGFFDLCRQFLVCGFLNGKHGF